MDINLEEFQERIEDIGRRKGSIEIEEYELGIDFTSFLKEQENWRLFICDLLYDYNRSRLLELGWTKEDLCTHVNGSGTFNPNIVDNYKLSLNISIGEYGFLKTRPFDMTEFWKFIEKNKDPKEIIKQQDDLITYYRQKINMLEKEIEELKNE